MEDTRQAESGEFAIGNIVADRYLIVDTLGAGGMGMVVKALDTKNFELPVVIKVLLDSISDKWSADKFNEERRALAKLQQCIEIVNLMDHGETPSGRKYTVLEFIEGRPLSRIIPELPNNLPRVAALFQQIANGVGFAHRHQIYHRDLKPDNIMVKNPGEKGELIKVLDFGIAKQAAPKDGNVEITTNIIGSPFYMAPNIFDANPRPLEDDIYALGLIAFEMVTGQYPDNFRSPEKKFSFTDLRNIQANIRLYPPSRQNPVLSAEIDQVILKALEPDPAGRYHSVEEFEKDLVQALNAISVTGEITETVTAAREHPKPDVTMRHITPVTVVRDKKDETKKPVNPYVFVAVIGAAGAVLGLMVILFFLLMGRGPQVAANTDRPDTDIQKRQETKTDPTPAPQNSSPPPVNTAATPANTNANTNPETAGSARIRPEDFSVAVEKKEAGGKTTVAGFDQIYKAGDGIRLAVFSEKPGSLQIFWKDSAGKAQSVHTGTIEAKKAFSFPSPQWIFFDDKPGTETIYVVISEPGSTEKLDIGLLDAQSGGKTKFNTEKGSAVQIVKLSHEK